VRVGIEVASEFCLLGNPLSQLGFPFAKIGNGLCHQRHLPRETPKSQGSPDGSSRLPDIRPTVLPIDMRCTTQGGIIRFLIGKHDVDLHVRQNL